MTERYQKRNEKFWHYHSDIYLGPFSSTSALNYSLFSKHNKVYKNAFSRIIISTYFSVFRMHCYRVQQVQVGRGKESYHIVADYSIFTFSVYDLETWVKFNVLFSLQCRCIHCFTLAILPKRFKKFKNLNICFMLRFISNHQMKPLILMKILWSATFISYPTYCASWFQNVEGDNIENLNDLQDEGDLENKDNL